MRILSVLFLCLFSAVTFAADRTTMVRQLMDAQGLTEMFGDMMAQQRKAVRDQAHEMLGQMMSQLNPSKEFEGRFVAVTDELMKSLETPWSAQEVTNVWAGIYGAKFTDQELSDLLKWYTSPLGQKDTKVSQASVAELAAHFEGLAKPLREKAIKQYVERLKIIAKECNCRK